MLVLTRRIGEEICIAGNVRVQVVRVDGHRVYLGITAPPEVRVDRLEVYQRRLQNEEEQPELVPPPRQVART